MEAAVATHIDHRTLGDAVLVVLHALLHIVERTDNVEVLVCFEGAPLLAFLYWARFDGVFLSLPARNAAIHNMHAGVSVKYLEHEPRSRRAVEALGVVKDNVVGVTDAESFHRFLKLGFGWKLFQKLSLRGAELEKVEILGVWKPLLSLNHANKNDSHKLVLRILLGSNVSGRVKNFHRVKTVKNPLC